MVDLNITIEEANLKKILNKLKEPEVLENKPKEEVEEMDTYGNVLLKYQCDIYKKKE